jgi:hypothetical protein
LEALLQAIYAFFSHSPKKYLEFQKLCEVLMEKGNKLFQNVKTKWINMLFLVQQVMEQYRPLITKMYVDVMKNNIATKNLSFFCELELILAILPLLDYIHVLIKLAKSCHVFVCDFIDAVKVC